MGPGDLGKDVTVFRVVTRVCGVGAEEAAPPVVGVGEPAPPRAPAAMAADVGERWTGLEPPEPTGGVVVPSRALVGALAELAGAAAPACAAGKRKTDKPAADRPPAPPVWGLTCSPSAPAHAQPPWSDQGPHARLPSNPTPHPSLPGPATPSATSASRGATPSSAHAPGAAPIVPPTLSASSPPPGDAAASAGATATSGEEETAAGDTAAPVAPPGARTAADAAPAREGEPPLRGAANRYRTGAPVAARVGGGGSWVTGGRASATSHVRGDASANECP
jgi:hypothetical protein